MNILSIAAALLLLYTTSSYAEDTQQNQQPMTAEQRITERLVAVAGESAMHIESISQSPVPNLYAVQITNGPMIYATADGNYFIAGDLFAVENDGFVNLAERKREQQRAAELALLDPRNMIIFSPKQPAKASIYVFTDPDCGFCRKLHQEMAELNRRGIEVRYLAFPRAGIESDTSDKLASAWCADDPQQALTTLKNGQSIPTNVCESNPVDEQFRLGQRIGVTGTPAIVTTSGQLIRGYVPAEQLAEMVTQ